jgi:hypothetical protein
LVESAEVFCLKFVREQPASGLDALIQQIEKKVSDARMASEAANSGMCSPVEIRTGLSMPIFAHVEAYWVEHEAERVSRPELFNGQQ